MSAPASVRVTVLVDTEPSVAFQIFTEDTAAWYRPAIAGAPLAGRPKGVLRFDRDAERVMFDDPPKETGRIVTWEDGRRLVFIDHLGTEVDVRFEAAGDQTKVTVEHRGLERLAPEVALSVAQYGWRRLAFQFETYLRELYLREEKP